MKIGYFFLFSVSPSKLSPSLPELQLAPSPSPVSPSVSALNHLDLNVGKLSLLPPPQIPLLLFRLLLEIIGKIIRTQLKVRGEYSRPSSRAVECDTTDNDSISGFIKELKQEREKKNRALGVAKGQCNDNYNDFSHCSYPWADRHDNSPKKVFSPRRSTSTLLPVQVHVHPSRPTQPKN
ncbi:hypothetical protein BT96DRAFT_1021815 [Gymnopus androsaceus JB14]|uniref:Uncharacterized protein n=1 Tax=Gymnopus androsaceus JB14 TaxID=1447944 RepID=A0A6A4HD85_9AGAR|nr:hypothetical protein BT96DRAFT_1021815 [Gymnopus androsaceus JB14]